MRSKAQLRKIKSVVIILLLAVLYFVGNGVSDKHSLPEFDKSITQIELTKHAACRMDCRQINEREIKEIIQNGKLNKNKSGYDKEHDNYTYAFEGYSYQNQHIRVVVTPRKNDLLIITVIDLDVDWACKC